MRKRRLGSRGPELSVIGLGTWALGGAGWQYSWGPQDDKDSIAAVHRAMELGITWIDTAAVYGLGHSEEVIGKAIAGRRSKILVATKCSRTWDPGSTAIVSRLSAQSVRKELEDSLRRLGTDYIDLYQIHWPQPEAAIEEGWGEIARAVKEGKGGGHTGAMTGAIVATAIVFFPAAPFFLFMHGKDITIPKGTEITAYVEGNAPLDLAKFAPQLPEPASPPSAQATMRIESTPSGADIELDGAFAGNTPSEIGVATGEHTVKITKPGYKSWERKVRVSTGTVELAAELEKVEASQPAAEAK